MSFGRLKEYRLALELERRMEIRKFTLD